MILEIQKKICFYTPTFVNNAVWDLMRNLVQQKYLEVGTPHAPCPNVTREGAIFGLSHC